MSYRVLIIAHAYPAAHEAARAAGLRRENWRYVLSIHDVIGRRGWNTAIVSLGPAYPRGCFLTWPYLDLLEHEGAPRFELDEEDLRLSLRTGQPAHGSFGPLIAWIGEQEARTC